ncbi:MULTISPECIES: beta strand repeat-containing protein [unclassified Bradyrhizobium]|uniref:beta strand repeat-containing protein n=1 Tax=unclassified Bradyrhizobium TaxID=2631580 RepID=UPI002FF25BA2
MAIINGTNGNDTRNGTAGDDQIFGLGGNDVLAGLGGADLLDGGTGTDTATYAASLAGVNVSLMIGAAAGGDAEGDTFVSIENLTGSGQNDTLEGDGGNNVLVGGAGTDTMSYEHVLAGVTVSLALTTAQNTIGAGTDTLSGFENLTGSAFDDTLTGNTGANVLSGGAGNDTLNGGTGADTLIGGTGNDSYVVDNVGDVVTEVVDEGIDTVQSSVSYTLGDNVENLTLLGSGNLSGTGNAADNVITGNSGNNLLAGLGGADTLIGNTGVDTATYAASAAGVNVSLTTGLGSRGDAEGDTLANIENLTGSAFDDTLEGNGGNNVLAGGAGTDTVTYERALAGVAVSLALASAQNTGGAGRDTLNGFENLTGSEFNDTLTGNADSNIILGLDGNDTLVGLGGADVLDGGEGTDTATYASSSAGVNVSLVSGTGIGGDAEGDTLISIENLTGSGQSDTLEGNGGDNVLAGGTGFDTVCYEHAAAGVTVSLALTTAQNTVGAGTDTLSSFENLTGSHFDNFLTGSSGANVITSFEGDDILDGGAGADTLIGGAGNDIYVVDHTGDAVTEATDQGTDTVQSSISYALGANVENLTLTGTGNLNGTGNAADNVIAGNVGNNVLAGLGGADTLIGNSGNDTATYAASAAGVDVSLATGTGSGGDAAGDTLSNIENLTGSALNDTLEGDGGDNVLAGGAGTDMVSYEHALAGVTVSLALTTAQNTVGAGTDRLSGFENLTGSAFDDTLTGNTAANVLSGEAGNDALNGGTGADTLIGGTGNDLYVVDNTGDVVTETVDEGTDTVQSSVSYTLGDDVENLTLTGTGALSGTGNADNNVITGNGGGNVLAGLGGADSLDGGAGTDTATYAASTAGVNVSLTTGLGSGGDAQADSLANIENLTGSAFDDTLEGSGGNNVLGGGAGTDTVTYERTLAGVAVSLALTNAQNTGGAGSDTLTGFENLTGSEFNDTLTGNAGANIILGLDGSDVLAGLGGADLLDGGAGTDTATYAASSAGVNVSLVTGTGSGGDAEGDTLISIENLTGSSQNDTLEGNDGDNVLAGGAGNDTVSYGHAVTGVTVSLALTTAQDTIGAGTDTLSTFENLTGSHFDNVLTGSSGANVITSFEGNDILDGGAGADTLIGGTGNDTYVVDNAGDVVTEVADEGVDTLQSSISYTLGANVENLTLTGTGNLNGTGNADDNVITGNVGNNVLAGLGGADTLIGNSGTDTVTYAASLAGVNVSLTTGTGSGGDADGDTLSNVENLTGSGLNDTLEGDGSNNVLTGGAGIDTVSYENALAGVTVSLALTAAQNTVGAGTDTLSSFENLTGSAFDDTLTGNTAANVLTGGAGNDTLNGGTGADTLIGGTGNDTYIVDNVGDVVTEAVNEGTDTVQSSMNYALGDDLENLMLTGAGALSGTGNADSNIITGNTGSNILAGLGGADAIDGGAGTDTATYAASAAGVNVNLTTGVGGGGDAEGDTLTNIENLTGSHFDNVLTGSAGTNALPALKVTTSWMVVLATIR